MKIDTLATDPAILQELGSRIAHARLSQNLTQVALAEKAGVSKNTIQRLEKGAAATQLGNLLRILRALNLIGRLEALFPPPQPSPIKMLKLEKEQRQRASKTQIDSETNWKWEDKT